MSDAAIGWACTATAILCFGCYAVPAKFVPTGDGWVFQWVECAGILLIGIITEFIAGSLSGENYLEPLGLLGGMFWCLGNTTVVPVVDTIGLGMGMLIWGGTSMIVGWATSYFGLAGLTKAEFTDDLRRAFNIVGVVIALLSIVFFLPIKPTITKKTDDEASEKTALVNYHDDTSPFAGSPVEVNQKSGATKKIIGVLLSVAAGFMYGINLTPITYLQEHRKHAGYTPHPLAFTLSHFAGIFFTSTAILIVYVVYKMFKRQRPEFYPQSVLPALVAGLGWGTAQAAWFVANSLLSPVITFPVISTTPGIISAIWGVLVFKEIQGQRNYFFLSAAFLLTFAGITFIAVSKT